MVWVFWVHTCFPVPRKVPDRECRTEYDQVCTQNTQTITKTRTDTQCKDIVKRVCNSARVEVGPVVAGPEAVVAGPVVATGAAIAAGPAIAGGAALAGGALAGRG